MFNFLLMRNNLFIKINSIFIIIIIISSPVDVNNRDEIIKIIKSCIGTKFVAKWSDLACQIALDAVSTVSIEENGRKEIDIKRYARIEKVNFIDKTCKIV